MDSCWQCLSGFLLAVLKWIPVGGASGSLLVVRGSLLVLKWIPVGSA